MEGEFAPDSGAPPASPRPPLAYEHLAFFEDKRCTLPEHESAVKRAIWNLTLGLAEIRADDRAYLARVMAIVGLKELIWRYVDVAKLVALAVENVIPATSELSRTSLAINMLAGTWVWITKGIPAHQAESVVLGVAAGSRVTSFEVASLFGKSECQMCVEEVAADGTVGPTLLAWNHYGTLSGWDHNKPSDYTPPTIAVKTTVTRFKVSVRHTYGFSMGIIGMCAGIAIFRAAGVAP